MSGSKHSAITEVTHREGNGDEVAKIGGNAGKRHGVRYSRTNVIDEELTGERLDSEA